MASPTDRRYAETHEWHLLEGDILTMGLTAYAVNELTDITYVEMYEVGTEVSAGGPVGEIESVKTTSDVYCVCPGRVIEVNENLADDPSLVNNDPFGAGWLVKLQVTDTAPLDALMDAAAYDEQFPL
ncbi:MAG: glycine cleavage system protein GcvH [Phycisphaerales bacterium]|nr:glycine cleavage system protein GcvH [Phycisphaerales bacterium]